MRGPVDGSESVAVPITWHSFFKGHPVFTRVERDQPVSRDTWKLELVPQARDVCIGPCSSIKRGVLRTVDFN